MKKLAFAALGVAGAMIASTAMADGHGKSTLAQVKEKGFVQCGVSQGLPGFSNADDAGEWTGLDVDMCRAVAAAVFGDASAVKFTPLSAKQRFTALASGEVDILSRNTTWTMTRDTQLGLNFACREKICTAGGTPTFTAFTTVSIGMLNFDDCYNGTTESYTSYYRETCKMRCAQGYKATDDFMDRWQDIMTFKPFEENYIGQALPKARVLMACMSMENLGVGSPSHDIMALVPEMCSTCVT